MIGSLILLLSFFFKRVVFLSRLCFGRLKLFSLRLASLGPLSVFFEIFCRLQQSIWKSTLKLWGLFLILFCLFNCLPWIILLPFLKIICIFLLLKFLLWVWEWVIAFLHSSCFWLFPRLLLWVFLLSALSSRILLKHSLLQHRFKVVFWRSYFFSVTFLLFLDQWNTLTRFYRYVIHCNRFCFHLLLLLALNIFLLRLDRPFIIILISYHPVIITSKLFSPRSDWSILVEGTIDKLLFFFDQIAQLVINISSLSKRHIFSLILFLMNHQVLHLSHWWLSSDVLILFLL